MVDRRRRALARRVLQRRGVEYTCAGNLISRVADAKGARLLEPNGTVVTALAVTTKGDRLYYTAGDAAKGIGV
jgi:hypothetical protein